MASSLYLDPTILPTLYDDPALSDVTISFSDHTVRAHKLVLAKASPYFKKAFLGKFKEAVTNELSLYEDDPDAVEAMLKYFYGTDPQELSLYFNFRLFAAASKYSVPGLLEQTIAKIESGLEDKWDTNTFPQLVREIYTNVPTHHGELKDIVKRIIRLHLKEMMKNEGMRLVLTDIPDLALDVLDHVAGEVSQAYFGKTNREKRRDDSWSPPRAKRIAQDEGWNNEGGAWGDDGY